MSDMSLNSGYYVVIKHVAELVDEVLLQLKTHDVQPETLRKLSGILTAAAEAETRDLSAGLLRIVLEEHSGYRESEWRQLARELAAGQASEAAVERLELIAEALEKERAGAYAKMRGL
jgi:hypothetical protein